MDSAENFSPSFGDVASIEADVSVNNSIVPRFSSEKTNYLYSEGQATVDVIETAPSFYLEGTGTIIPVVDGKENYIRAIVQKTISSDFSPKKTIDLFGAGTLLLNISSDLQETQMYSDGSIVPSLSSEIVESYLTLSDSIQPTFSSIADVIELVETLVKILTDSGWMDKTPAIYLKTDSDTWTSVPLYTKQYDRSWM